MLVINNGTVVTMDDERSVYFGGHVVIDGDRITAVGPGSWSGADASASAEVIDASGMIVMPGLIDLHYHTAVGKGLCDHLPLWESLEEFWYPSIRALDADSAHWAAAASYLESVKNGVDTTIVDGQILMRGRRVLTMDESLVLREANRALTRVTDAIGWGSRSHAG